MQDIQTIPIIANNSQTNSSSANSLVNSVMTGVANINKSAANKSAPNNNVQTYSSEEIVRLKSELDDLLAEECPWCGERILKLIKEPFINELNYESVFNSWL